MIRFDSNSLNVTARCQYGRVDGQLVYAIGDIHGCYSLLKKLLQQIEQDAATRRNRQRPVLIFCGDYVDRGPDSARVLDALCWLKRHAPYDVHFLKGNHDEVMLDYIANPAEHRAWIRFGGGETLRSYDVNPPEDPSDLNRHLEARCDLLEKLPVAHLRFLEDLKPMLMIGEFVFVHAGLRPGKRIEGQLEADMLWIRDEFIADTAGFGRTVVHGHTWSGNEIIFLPHRIGIDTGAYSTGVLAALRIEDDETAAIYACSTLAPAPSGPSEGLSNA